MYYEEKLIGGVLHWRCTPDGEWKPMSQERLTAIVQELRRSRIQALFDTMESENDEN